VSPSALAQLAALCVHEPGLDQQPEPSIGASCPLRWMLGVPSLPTTAQQHAAAPGMSQLLEVLLRAEQGKGLEEASQWSGAASRLVRSQGCPVCDSVWSWLLH
jgi:hypothetical protein